MIADEEKKCLVPKKLDINHLETGVNNSTERRRHWRTQTKLENVNKTGERRQNWRT